MRSLTETLQAERATTLTALKEYQDKEASSNTRVEQCEAEVGGRAGCSAGSLLWGASTSMRQGAVGMRGSGGAVMYPELVATSSVCQGAHRRAVELVGLGVLRGASRRAARSHRAPSAGRAVCTSFASSAHTHTPDSGNPR